MYKILLILFASLFLFSTCKKNKIPNEPDIYFGNAKANLNDSLVTFNKCRGLNISITNDTISFGFEEWDGLIKKKALFINKVHKILGRQRVYKTNYLNSGNKSSSNYSTLSDDGDVLCDYYDVLEFDSLINNITITSFDNSTKEIKGTFDVTYLRDTSRVRCKPNSQDTIRIRNGEFHTKIF